VRDRVRGAYAHRIGMLAAFVGIVAAEDRHITAAAVILVDEAPRRGARLERSDHFQKNGVDRQQRILQAIFGDVAVAVAFIEPHDGGNVRDHGLQMRRHQADLPQPHIASHVSDLSMVPEHRLALLDERFRRFLVIGGFTRTRMMDRCRVSGGPFRSGSWRVLSSLSAAKYFKASLPATNAKRLRKGAKRRPVRRSSLAVADKSLRSQ